MNTTVFTWKILNMEAIMSYNDLTDVVRTVYWQLEGHDDDNKYGRHWGIQQLDVDSIDSSTFTGYSSLTESQVLTWVKTALNTENPQGDGNPNFTTRLENEVQAEMDTEEIGSRRTGVPW
jgi:hypothetical protein